MSSELCAILLSLLHRQAQLIFLKDIKVTGTFHRIAFRIEYFCFGRGIHSPDSLR